MERLLQISVNLSDYSLTQSGTSEFFYGDTNKIEVTLLNKEEGEKYYVNMSGNPRGMGSYISELVEENDKYILHSEDFNGFLLGIGDVKCNIHITNSKKEKITTVTFTLKSKMSSDRNPQTVISQSDIKTLSDIYQAADFLEELDVQKIEDAVKVVEGLDIQAIEEAVEISKTLDSKVKELEQTLTNSQQINSELQNTVIEINTKLENGDFNGKDGDPGTPGTPGEKGDDGFSPVVTLTEETDGVLLSIQDKTHTDSYKIKNGTDGKPGTNGDPGYTPVRGTDYWTENDKTEIYNECVNYLDTQILGGSY